MSKVEKIQIFAHIGGMRDKEHQNSIKGRFKNKEIKK
jgi:hypothetical protein